MADHAWSCDYWNLERSWLMAGKNTVGPSDIILPHPFLPRPLIRCHIFRSPIQTKSVASVGGVGLRCRKSMGGGGRYVQDITLCKRRG